MGFDWNAHNARQAEFENSRPFGDKKEVFKRDKVLEIVEVRRGTTKWGDTWFVDINIGEEELTLSFGAGVDKGFERRDLLLAEFADHLNENGSEPIKVKLAKWGTDSAEKSAAWGFEPA